MCKNSDAFWLKIGTWGELLWTWQWTSEFHKMLRHSWEAEELLVSQEGLGSIEQFIRYDCGLCRMKVPYQEGMVPVSFLNPCIFCLLLWEASQYGTTCISITNTLTCDSFSSTVRWITVGSVFLLQRAERSRLCTQHPVAIIHLLTRWMRAQLFSWLYKKSN